MYFVEESNSFDTFEMMGIIFFIVVISIFIYIAFKSLSQWHTNNNSPKLSVVARVVSKRNAVSGGGHDMHAFTNYYVTFEVESGDRMELYVSAEEYGMLAEGDEGKLTFQGTRYLGFERNR